MGIIELFILAVGLSMDAFAVSVCKGVSVGKVNKQKCMLAGLYFGGFQAGMPLIGYFLGVQFKDYIISIDHWIAFFLLGLIGINMVRESFQKEECSCQVCPEAEAFGWKTMLLLAVATSVDALAVGVTFAFLEVQILPAVIFIGVTTFVFSALGIKIGSVFGDQFKTKAELAGGMILICMGIKILLEHTGILG